MNIKLNFGNNGSNQSLQNQSNGDVSHVEQQKNTGTVLEISTQSENVANFGTNQTSQNTSSASKETQAFASYKKKKAKKSSEDDDYFNEGPGLPSYISTWIIFIFGTISVALYYYYSYITVASEVTIPAEDQQFVERVKNLEQNVDQYLNINEYDFYSNIDFATEGNSETISEILDSKDLNYIHKRDLTSKATHDIADQIIIEGDEIDNIKSNIAEFGFFNEELATLMQTDKTEASIQESLYSLETVRFATAIKVFSFLDNFVAPFTRKVRQTREYVDSQMRMYIERGEVDVSNYLKTCRNNPFEKIDGCNAVGDFQNYFKYLEEKDDFDTELFLELMTLADQKLEEEEFPSLSILFDRFDPNSQKLSFTVAVNTTSFDRAQLQSAGIFAPQVFIISNLVNLLKQSKFVLGSDININKLDVEKKNIVIGGNIEQIFTSDIRFELPLQKATQREIFDFEFKESLDNIQNAFDIEFEFAVPEQQNPEETDQNQAGEPQESSDNNTVENQPTSVISEDETNQETGITESASTATDEFTIDTIEQ